MSTECHQPSNAPTGSHNNNTLPGVDRTPQLHPHPQHRPTRREFIALGSIVDLVAAGWNRISNRSHGFKSALTRESHHHVDDLPRPLLDIAYSAATLGLGNISPSHNLAVSGGAGPLAQPSPRCFVPSPSE